jgi:hypothetical protein
VKRWVNVKILVGLSMLSSLVLGFASLAQEDHTPRQWTHEGRTQQGWPLDLRIENGKVRTFFTQVTGICNGKQPHTIGWRPAANGAPARFSARGPRFEAEEVSQRQSPDGTWSHVTLRIAGRISDNEGKGTVRYVGRYRYTDGRVSQCESPVVSWSVLAD